MTLETIKSGNTEPTTDIDHLINHLAIIVRATRDEYGLTDQQKKALHDRFCKIYDSVPGMADRVIDAAEAKNQFWKPHSDTVLKFLKDADILVDTLAV